ncbi:2-keto-4-pentenoate hydratase [Microbacterium sp. CPCC 204701]|uniref:2-keto-4-pentenoate hydratase n=1 Tax=Microbacterium sp. CPCC 204701 TaxID=2493084 RepID=UPI000FDBD5CD|nr:fumarylacetoacetate hydrolase family protein [Microbacterium sp. CPCC 204701]
MNASDVAKAAGILLEAERSGRPLPQLTVAWPNMSEADAYAVQRETLRMRVARGESVVGIKLGLTSRAKQTTMGIDSPTVSWLTDAMRLRLNEPVAASGFIHPRAEPEIAFVLGRELRGRVTPEQALSAVERVHAAVEIIDSRYTDFQFRIEDTIADNSSSGGFVISPVGLRPNDVDLFFEPVLLTEAGIVVDSATGAAVYGHPGEALAWAVNALAEQGLAVPRGSIVLTGGMTDAIPLRAGVAVAARFGRLGSVEVRVSGGAS